MTARAPHCTVVLLAMASACDRAPVDAAPSPAPAASLAPDPAAPPAPAPVAPPAAIPAPPPAPAPAGSSVVDVRAFGEAQAAIRVAPLAAEVHQGEQRAYGKVLSLQGLADLGRTHAAAQAQARSAAVQQGVAREQYLRLKRLNEVGQNASTRSLQAAQGAFDVATADAEAGVQSLRALQAAIRQRWGDVIAGWLISGSSRYGDLIDGRQVVVQVTLPVGVQVSPVPDAILVRSPAAATAVRASYVSPAPETDPRIQGISYFYEAPPDDLLPGMTVVAEVPTGPPRNGVAIPSAAIVWWQGVPWLYEQVAPGRFVRREVPTDTPLEDGYFASSGFPPGTLVAVRGAQELLSLETVPPARGEEEDED